VKALLLIPHRLAHDRHEAVRRGDRPQADYDALAEAIRAQPGGQADILDLHSVEREGGWAVRLIRRFRDYNWALAVLGFQRCHEYDVVLTHGENVGLPFALLISTLSRRPRHVTTAYYFTGKRNFLWYRALGAHRSIDKIFTLARRQYEVGRERLRISEDKLVHVEACGFIDAKFFGTAMAQAVNERQICSAGREFRDYGTLLRAVATLPDIKLKIDPSSPWSLHKSEVEGLSIPPNAEICRMEMGAVRNLYAESAVVVIPLYDNPIGAGMTTVAEVMAMGKPAIVTSPKDNGFAGRPDIIDGENFLAVDVGDVAGMRSAIERLMNDGELRRRIGANARKWAEKHAGRQEWLDIVIEAMSGPMAGSANRRSRPNEVLEHLGGE